MEIKMLKDDVYVMDAIIGYRRFYGINQYQIKWRDYPLTAATWEPWSNILDPSADILLQMAACKCKWEQAHDVTKDAPETSQDVILNSFDMARLQVLHNALKSCVVSEPMYIDIVPPRKRPLHKSNDSRKLNRARLEMSSIDNDTDCSSNVEPLWDFALPNRPVTKGKYTVEGSPACSRQTASTRDTPTSVDPTSLELSLADSLLASPDPQPASQDELRLKFLKSRIENALTHVNHHDSEPIGVEESALDTEQPKPNQSKIFGFDDEKSSSNADLARYDTTTANDVATERRTRGTEQSPVNSPSGTPEESVTGTSPPTPTLEANRSSCHIIKFTMLRNRLHVIYEHDGEIKCETYDTVRRLYAQELLSYWHSSLDSVS